MLSTQKLKIEDLAGIEYYGSAGITARCLTALTMLIQASDDIISRAFLLADLDSCSKCGTHCFLLWPESSDPIAIELKTGVAGAGQRAIAQILSYMGEVLIAEDGVDTRGTLVAGDFNDKAIATSRVVPNLTLKKYKVEFSFETAE